MAKRMLVDAAHPEETRVVVLNGNRLEEFDFETSTKKQIKGNIYLAKVTRVEPSLQAAFVEYGGNRHGFLAFSEIHPDYYKIPVADRQAALDAERAAEQAADAREEAERERDGDALPAFFSPPSRDFEEAPEAQAHDAPGDMIHAHDDEPGDEHPGGDSEPEPWHAPSADAGSEGQPPYESPLEPAEEHRADAQTHENGESHGDGGEPAGAGPLPTTIEPHNDSVETVGGDEIEETTRPRARPFRHYKIQEVIKRRQIMLVQVAKEERGNKGAALTTYLSLAGRYCVLMPNTPRGGGVSRKITNNIDRRRLKDLMSDLDVPDGMGVIVRTAGSERSKTEIKRDFEYLLRLWEEIRDLTLKSTAPALIYEEGNLIKRSIRDLYARDIEEVLVDGDEGYRTAKAFMKMLMPSHAKRVKPYRDPTVPLFHRFQVEGQIDAIHSPVMQLRSGGYVVISPTEALVAIDVNSGRSTRERNIEETALKTNIEAAEEVARQLRLRDLAGLIVIDFIDMEEHRNRASVERRLKEAMRFDRARIQLGRISPFGLLELSRQRLRPSIVEASTQPCPYCNGSGHIRSIESTALHVLRAIEEEGMRRRSAEITVAVPPKVALYILNQKRTALQQAEVHFGFRVTVTSDDSLVPPAFRLDRMRMLTPAEIEALPAAPPPPVTEEEDDDILDEQEELQTDEAPPRERHQAHQDEPQEEQQEARHEPHHDAPREERHAARHGAPREKRGEEADGNKRRRRHRRGRRGEEVRETRAPTAPPAEPIQAPAGGEDGPHIEESDAGARQPAAAQRPDEAGSESERRRRRRGRRGGRRRRRDGSQPGDRAAGSSAHEAAPHDADPMIAMPPDEPHYEDEVVPEPYAAPPEPAPSHANTSRSEAERGNGREMPPEPPAPIHVEPAREPEPTVQFNVPPAPDAATKPANPKKGWWRR